MLSFPLLLLFFCVVSVDMSPRGSIPYTALKLSKSLHIYTLHPNPYLSS